MTQVDKVNANHRISGIKDMDVNQDYRGGHNVIKKSCHLMGRNSKFLSEVTATHTAFSTSLLHPIYT